MQGFKRCGWLIAGLGVVLLFAGCSSYYQVTDPLSGRNYYAQEIENFDSGAVKVVDARSGVVVTLQNSEVKEISSDEYEAALAAKAAAPAAAPAVVAPAAPAAEAAPALAPATDTTPAVAPQ